ncbi:MAG: class II aldolase/adducin family protein [Chloroflexota bacterium]
MAESLVELKTKCALAHRILTMTGSMGDITGHVMVRIPGTNEFLYRCRNDRDDVSPAYCTPRSMHRMALNTGDPLDPLADGYRVSGERFIGLTVMNVRPEVNCVIHAHPPAQVLCSITGVELQSIVGSQNWAGSFLTRPGIGVYPRSLTIVNHVLGQAMLRVMGNKDVVLLYGHGNVVAGRSVEDATVKAVRVENLARLCWQLAVQQRSNKPLWEIPWEDWDDMTSGAGIREALEAQGASEVTLGETGNWDYYVQMLQDGAEIPEECSPNGFRQY